MSIIEKRHTTYQVACDMNKECGQACGPPATSVADALDAALEKGSTFAWAEPTGRRGWSCPACQAKEAS